ncbi:MAG TPA: hypothetical protein VGK81_11295 [Anaerolineae bacterium]|jgi:hypothetical protein
MKLFNRIFTIVSLLVLSALVLGALFISAESLTPLLTNLIRAREILPSNLIALIGLVFLVIVLFLLWLELRRPGARTVEVVRSTGGHIRITTGHVEQRLADQVNAMSGVIQTKVHIHEKDNSVVAHIDVIVAQGLDLVTKGEDVAAKTREVVQDQLGLKLFGKPLITIKSSKTKPVEVTPVKTTPSTVHSPSTESTIVTENAASTESTPSDKA